MNEFFSYIESSIIGINDGLSTSFFYGVTKSAFKDFVVKTELLLPPKVAGGFSKSCI